MQRLKHWSLTKAKRKSWRTLKRMKNSKNFYLVHLNVVYDGIAGGYNIIGEIDGNNIIDREAVIKDLVDNNKLEDMDDVECIESMMIISEKDYLDLLQTHRGYVWFGPCNDVSGTDIICRHIDPQEHK